MSLKAQHFYDFKNFRLDLEERMLLHDNKPIPLTPKMFHLLKVLIDNRGRVVEKDALMQEVWQGSFVEESNLAFNIGQIRKVLGDNARQPTFIETVPKRGYRFIAEVKETTGETESVNDLPAISQPAETLPANRLKFKKILLPAAAAVLIIGVIVTGFWYAQSTGLDTDIPVLSAPFSSQKLSTNGKVLQAVISPDGKKVVYSNGFEGRQSIWIRQLESGDNVEIIPPSDDFYYGLAVSPDNNFLYFVRCPKSCDSQFDLYRVSIFGGVPRKIVSETQGWISLSPGGEKISFVRCYNRDDESCSLWIADAIDGKNEQKLVSRSRPVRIADNEFSPDGKTIAFAAGQSTNQANEFSLAEFDLEKGTERALSEQKFFDVKNLAWLPDQKSLLITASRIPNKNFLIWQISAATGEAQPLTKDSETYFGLSLSKDASLLISTQVKQDFQLHLYNTESPAPPRVLADASSAFFAPDGKIIFSSLMTGNDEIWSINPDGSNLRQLTNSAADESSPIVSPGDNSIFFTSNRTGEAHVWRMNTDGSNQQQISKSEGGFPLSVSLDGKWLYYYSGLQKALRRVSTRGGDEQLIWNKGPSRYAVSPDGSQIGFMEKKGGDNILTIISPADGQTIKTFKLAGENARLVDLEWTRDGENLAYVLAGGGITNNTLWFQPLSGQTPRKIVEFGNEEIAELAGFALAPDGKSFAVAQGGWLHDAVLLKGLR